MLMGFLKINKSLVISKEKRFIMNCVNLYILNSKF
jgi:hypothetical protein